MGTAAAGWFMVRSHEGADLCLGVGPKAASGPELANELPVVGGFAAEIALGHLVGLEERINL